MNVVEPTCASTLKSPTNDSPSTDSVTSVALSATELPVMVAVNAPLACVVLPAKAAVPLIVPVMPVEASTSEPAALDKLAAPKVAFTSVALTVTVLLPEGSDAS